jgi:hypothetical protein
MVNKNGASTADKPVYLPPYQFLCPTRAPVRAFVKRRIEELLKYPVAGIHLDYLQFPWVILPALMQSQVGILQEQEQPEYDYCYCEACREAFKAQTEIDPINFNMASASDAWRQFRYERLTSFVNQELAPLIRGAGKLVSASVLPDWENARQDWGSWQLDAALPLLHHTLYEEDISWIGFQTQESVQRLGSKGSCYSGLLVSNLSPPDLTGAVRLCLESGARGVGLYSAETMTDLHWTAFQGVADEAEAQANQRAG